MFTDLHARRRGLPWCACLASVASALAGLVGCTAPRGSSQSTVTVQWQRLVTEHGGTCDRCGTTQAEVRRAVDTLRRSLRPLHLRVVFEEAAINPDDFARDPAQSNRVLLDGRSVEDWLGGRTGMNPCGSCCAQIGSAVQCRTVAVDGQTYEAVPAQLIVRAGLRAAEAALARSPTGSGCSAPAPAVAD